jgi:hypothetical protein
MGFAGFGKTQLRYDMFDLKASAEEARRLNKCANIYHKGQDLAWDGRAVLGELLAEHGGIKVDADKREALKRIFSIIMWGELAAWKISSQLADRLVPLEAKMAATSQAFDEARHFYVMHDYLVELGYEPEELERAPQALLDLVLDTDNLAYKLLGMQLMIETIALTLFQTVRELRVEPVLTELMKYFERDEARHVGLGMQYLPTLMRSMSKRQIGSLLTFQAKLLAYGLWEQKILERDFAVLGVDPRHVIDRCRQKQVVALSEAFEALGLPFDQQRNVAVSTLLAAVELLFPTEQTRPVRARVRAALVALRGMPELPEEDPLAVHRSHEIKTARGVIAGAELDA